jgi:DNA-binding response OmpR family regulator
MADTTTSNLREPVILVVDDDPHVNFLLTAHLKLGKMNPIPVHSIDECLNKIDEMADLIDVATVDGKLAAERGGLIISRIKEKNPYAKILVVANDDSARLRILQYGADDYIMKPTHPDTIEQKISWLASMKGAFMVDAK